MIDCNDCLYINLTEEKQTKNKESHICNKYNKRLYHFDKHPALIPCNECNGKDYRSTRKLLEHDEFGMIDIILD